MMPKCVGKFEIQDTCIITGRGQALLGRMIEGKIHSNDFITIEYDSKIIKHSISQVEIVRTKNPNINIGIILKHALTDTNINAAWVPNQLIAKVFRIK